MAKAVSKKASKKVKEEEEWETLVEVTLSNTLPSTPMMTEEEADKDPSNAIQVEEIFDALPTDLHSDSEPLISAKHPIFLDGRELKGRDEEIYYTIKKIVYEYYSVRWDDTRNVFEGRMLGVADNKVKAIVRLIITL